MCRENQRLVLIMVTRFDLLLLQQLLLLVPTYMLCSLELTEGMATEAEAAAAFATSHPLGASQNSSAPPVARWPGGSVNCDLSRAQCLCPCEIFVSLSFMCVNLALIMFPRTFPIPIFFSEMVFAALLFSEAYASEPVSLVSSLHIENYTVTCLVTSLYACR